MPLVLSYVYFSVLSSLVNHTSKSANLLCHLTFCITSFRLLFFPCITLVFTLINTPSFVMHLLLHPPFWKTRTSKITGKLLQCWVHWIGMSSQHTGSILLISAFIDKHCCSESTENALHRQLVMPAQVLSTAPRPMSSLYLTMCAKRVEISVISATIRRTDKGSLLAPPPPHSLLPPLSLSFLFSNFYDIFSQFSHLTGLRTNCHIIRRFLCNCLHPATC